MLLLGYVGLIVLEANVGYLGLLKEVSWVYSRRKLLLVSLCDITESWVLKPTPLPFIYLLS